MKPMIAALTMTTAMTMTPAAAQEADLADVCQNAFFSVDESKDGMVTAQEAESTGGLVFESLDLDSSGAIDREEYVACAETMQQMSSGMMPSEDGEATFTEIDTDQDSNVSAREYFEMARAAYEDSMSEDGQSVDMTTGFEKPFIKIPQDMTASDLGLEDRQRFLDLAALTFATADTDLDGNLTREEWMARADQYEIDIESINQRFDQSDSDGDDTLSAEEYGTNWQAITGSAMGKADKDGFTDQSKGIPAYYFYISAM